jgi:hypothetical protein
MDQNRKAVKRAFSGLVGSSFVRISEPTTTPIQTPSQESVARLSTEIIKKRGRPRQHQDAAARQRACRARKALSAEARRREAEFLKIIQENYDLKGRLSGEFSGGNSPEKMSLIDDATRRAEDGWRHVTPTGWSSKTNEETRAKDRKIETDFTWIQKQKFPLNWKLDAQDKREIVHDLTQHIFTAEGRALQTVFDPDVVDIGIQNVLTCTICRVSVNIPWQAVEHVELYHRGICRKIFRSLAPGRTDCNKEHHEFLQKRGDKFCPRCKKNFVTEPAAEIEAGKPLIRRQLAVLDNVDRNKGRQDSPPGVSAATI